MPDCAPDAEDEAIAALVERRQQRTSAAREALAKTFSTPEERREHMRGLALRSAQIRRQRRLERLREAALAEAQRRGEILTTKDIRENS